MEQCAWYKAWIGRCTNSPVSEEGSMLVTRFCAEHQGKQCVGCGKEADRDCDHTGIQFVCGAPLCANCTHSPPQKDSPNWFGLGGEHKAHALAHAEWEAYWAPEKTDTLGGGE